jgi:hypothetical protein
MSVPLVVHNDASLSALSSLPVASCCAPGGGSRAGAEAAQRDTRALQPPQARAAAPLSCTQAQGVAHASACTGRRQKKKMPSRCEGGERGSRREVGAAAEGQGRGRGGECVR